MGREPCQQQFFTLFLPLSPLTICVADICIPCYCSRTALDDPLLRPENGPIRQSRAPAPHPLVAGCRYSSVGGRCGYLGVAILWAAASGPEHRHGHHRGFHFVPAPPLVSLPVEIAVAGPGSWGWRSGRPHSFGHGFIPVPWRYRRSGADLPVALGTPVLGLARRANQTTIEPRRGQFE